MNFIFALQPLSDEGVDFVLPFVCDAATLANDTVFTLNSDLGILDLLAEVSGIGSYAEVRAACVEVYAFDRRVRALDLRALILAKKAAGRPKDLLILPELEGLLEAIHDE